MSGPEPGAGRDADRDVGGPGSGGSGSGGSGSGGSGSGARLDGNAMAGELAQVFAVDVTAAGFTCAGCGHGGVVATLRVWALPMGAVGRCPHCDDVVVRVVTAGDRVVLDLRGTVRLEMPVSD